MRLVFSAGEASGDAYASEIARRMKAWLNPSDMTGIGGPRLRGQGIELWADSSRWGAIGLAQSLKVAPRIILEGLKVQRRIARLEPGLFLPVDYGFMNLRLARFAKRRAWKVLYFIPPSSWRRDRQGKDLPQVADCIVTPFPWSAQMLRQAGAEAWFWGHPLVDVVSLAPDAPEREGFAVLPGSRIHEAKHNLPVLAKACRGLQGPFRMVVAPTLDKEAAMKAWAGNGGPECILVSTAAEALKAARAGIVCSGTATLEAALCGCPSIIVYNLSPAMWAEVALLGLGKKIKHIGLPNILLDRRIVPELIAEAGDDEAVRLAAEKIWRDGPERQDQLAAFDEIKSLCGQPGSLDRTAKLAAELLGLETGRPGMAQALRNQ